jgi:hypothetical protein
MSGEITRTRKRNTVTLSILVALGVIALLAAAEYAIPRWLHSGPGESGSFFSSKRSTPGPSAPRSVPAPSIKPGADSDPATDQSNRRASHQKFPALKSLVCQPDDSRCWDRKTHATNRKPTADAGARSQALAPSDPQSSSQRQGYTRPSGAGQDARATEENLRASEDATAHLVELEREELDRLSDRARAMSDRVEAAQNRPTAPDRQLRDDLAFSQQRLRSDLNQTDAALKTADVQKAKIYLDLAKGELEKIAKLLGRQ